MVTPRPLLNRPLQMRLFLRFPLKGARAIGLFSKAELFGMRAQFGRCAHVSPGRRYPIAADVRGSDCGS